MKCIRVNCIVYKITD